MMPVKKRLDFGRGYRNHSITVCSNKTFLLLLISCLCASKSTVKCKKYKKQTNVKTKIQYLIKKVETSDLNPSVMCTSKSET